MCGLSEWGGGNYSSLTSNESSGEMEGAGKEEKENKREAETGF